MLLKFIFNIISLIFLISTITYAQKVNISGIVKEDNYLNEPTVFSIPGISIKIVGKDLEFFTNRNGKFEFEVENSEVLNEIKFVFFHPEYSFKIIDVKINNPEFKVDDISLRSKYFFESKEQFISKEKIKIEGSVKNQDNIPLSNAQVCITGLPFYTYTKSNGLFEINLYKDYLDFIPEKVGIYVKAPSYIDTVLYTSKSSLRTQHNFNLKKQNIKEFESSLKKFSYLVDSLQTSITFDKNQITKSYELLLDTFSIINDKNINVYLNNLEDQKSYYQNTIKLQKVETKILNDSIKKLNTEIEELQCNKELYNIIDSTQFFNTQITFSTIPINYPNVLSKIRLEYKFMFLDEKLNLSFRHFHFKEVDKQAPELTISTIFRESRKREKNINLYFELGASTSLGKMEKELNEKEYPGYIGLFFGGGLRWYIPKYNIALGLGLEYDRNWLSQKFTMDDSTYYYQECLMLNLGISFRRKPY